MNNRPRRRRTHRTLSTCILGAVAPLMVTAGVVGMGYRAEVAAAPAHHARLLAVNPVQCIEENMRCAQDALSGNNPCDPIPC